MNGMPFILMMIESGMLLADRTGDFMNKQQKADRKTAMLKGLALMYGSHKSLITEALEAAQDVVDLFPEDLNINGVPQKPVIPVEPEVVRDKVYRLRLYLQMLTAGGD